jgi:hypothetical protein
MLVYLLAARTYCQKMGGDLASLSDPSAFAAVQGICQHIPLYSVHICQHIPLYSVHLTFVAFKHSPK